MTHAVTVEPFLVNALAALFDDGVPAPQIGEPLPPYWHLAACVTPYPSRELGVDGHPREGIMTPPADLPRRMFAGGSLQIDEWLLVGETIGDAVFVADTTDKVGRSGRLQFVTVVHELCRDDDVVSQREEQRIVYREPTIDRPGERPVRAPHVRVERLLTPGSKPLSATLCADPVSLQRFSALTSNAHRIHYDHPYATEVEGYPDLVVHGPLVLLSLLELLRLEVSRRAVKSVDFKASAPVFCGDEVELLGTPNGHSTVLEAKVAGAVAMSATVELAQA